MGATLSIIIIIIQLIHIFNDQSCHISEKCRTWARNSIHSPLQPTHNSLQMLQWLCCKRVCWGWNCKAGTREEWWMGCQIGKQAWEQNNVCVNNIRIIFLVLEGEARILCCRLCLDVATAHFGNLVANTSIRHLQMWRCNRISFWDDSGIRSCEYEWLNSNQWPKFYGMFWCLYASWYTRSKSSQSNWKPSLNIGRKAVVNLFPNVLTNVKNRCLMVFITNNV